MYKNSGAGKQWCQFHIHQHFKLYSYNMQDVIIMFRTFFPQVFVSKWNDIVTVNMMKTNMNSFGDKKEHLNNAGWQIIFNHPYNPPTKKYCNIATPTGKLLLRI